MESGSLKNTPDFQALRDEYAHLAFELRRGPIESASHARITQEAKGWKAKLAALMEGIGNMFTQGDDHEKEQQLRAEIDTAEKVMSFAQKPELAEAAQEWKRHVDLMALAKRRIAIFTQEQEIASRMMKKASSTYSPSVALQAHNKLVKAEQEVEENRKALQDLTRELFGKIHEALQEPHS